MPNTHISSITTAVSWLVLVLCSLRSGRPQSAASVHAFCLTALTHYTTSRITQTGGWFIRPRVSETGRGGGWGWTCETNMKPYCPTWAKAQRGKVCASAGGCQVAGSISRPPMRCAWLRLCFVYDFSQVVTCCYYYYEYVYDYGYDCYYVIMSIMIMITIFFLAKMLWKILMLKITSDPQIIIFDITSKYHWGLLKTPFSPCS